MKHSETNRQNVKRAGRLSTIFMVTLGLAMLLPSCDTTPEFNEQQDILPQTFSVDIPSSISNKDLVSGGRAGGRTQQDLQGNDIYQHLGTFIAVGEGASKIVEHIINGIRVHRIDRVMTMSYQGDDQRTKNLVVSAQVTFEGTTWDHQLTITDADSESGADGGKALQVFWNKSTTVKGIAIIKPYHCNRLENANAKDALFRIDYSEAGELGYEAQMEVRIAGLPLESPLNNPYSMSTLHMFAGKKGDVVDVYGNSNHPNAILFSGNTGFNWAFVASGNEVKDIGVAEVGLPPSRLDQSDRTVLLKEHSIKNVFTREINSVWPGLDAAALAAYLSNTAAPGYFSQKKGFISGGVSPGPEWDELAKRLDALTPYNPLHTTNLTISFK